MKLSEIKHILDAEGIQLTRSLGQNFLHDGNQLRRIVQAAELTGTDRVLEIGPGLGPLTELLIERAGEVLAIEKDARLVRVLEKRFECSLSAGKRLSLVHEDALDFIRREQRDWSEWKLVANLPYSVASPILVDLAQAPGAPRRMVVTLQLEVARRLMAKAGTEDYGVLTLLLQVVYKPKSLFKIPASCFFPAPEVDSACVTLERRAAPFMAADQLPFFTHLVKQSFSQRRKMMLKLLKSELPEDALQKAFGEAAVPWQARAEDVSLEQFIRLTRILGTDSRL